MSEHDAAQLRAEAEAMEAAAGFRRGDLQLDYGKAGAVPLPPKPDSAPMVARGLRLPVDIDQRVRTAAERAGVPYSSLVREWIELGLAEIESDQQVSLAAIRRAIAHAAAEANHVA